MVLLNEVYPYTRFRDALYLFIGVCAHACYIAHLEVRGELLQSQFSSSAFMRVLGVELRLPGLLSLYLLSQTTGPKLETIKPGGWQMIHFLMPWKS